MDRVAGAAVRWNIDAIKEPRGFIKFIEWIIAIFAFATTTSSSSSSSLRFSCLANQTVPDTTLHWSYPFRLDQSQIDVTYCNGTKSSPTPYGNFAAPSQFYVFVGVMAFLYSMAALVLYVCFDDKYRKLDQLPIADFIVSCAFVLLWLISSSAWATGVSQLKEYTDPGEWIVNIIPECKVPLACDTFSFGNFAGLNVSLIFGFLNMCVWAGNLWFLYKETKWFKVEPTEPPQASAAGTPEYPQQQIPQSI